MTRLIKDDFDSLNKYIETYSLANLLDNKRYVSSLSAIHKKYFALLLLLSEITTNYAEISSMYHLGDEQSRRFISYYKETVSDYGCALFNWVHGSYRVSLMILRSSIENILRVALILQDLKLIDTPSVATLFENAFSSENYQHPSIQRCYHKFKNLCRILCAVSHASTIEIMQNLSSLNEFPSFESGKASNAMNQFITCATWTIDLSCLLLHDIIFKRMQPMNLDIIMGNLPNELKQELHNYSA